MGGELRGCKGAGNLEDTYNNDREHIAGVILATLSECCTSDAIIGEYEHQLKEMFDVFGSLVPAGRHDSVGRQ